jgi:Nif-specific regulatory protein
VGKELIAHAIHYGSDRAERPMVKFHCAALPESVIESELFGHERGAFTGATATRAGRFELADGGTIFLDEIGDLSPTIQTKLLRVLQEREFERLGGARTINVDVRVVAATNRDLDGLTRSGAFREDLYYRLNVFPVSVPPLRERKTDILLLADHFIAKYNRSTGKKIARISTGAIDMLVSYHWPGNVRELENCIERAILLSEDGVIHGFHLPPSLQNSGSSNRNAKGSLQSRVDALEYEIIVEALKENGGNMSRAARDLGLTDRVMGLRARKYGIHFKDFRTNGDRRTKH